MNGLTTGIILSQYFRVGGLKSDEMQHIYLNVKLPDNSVWIRNISPVELMASRSAIFNFFVLPPRSLRKKWYNV